MIRNFFLIFSAAIVLALLHVLPINSKEQQMSLIPADQIKAYVAEEMELASRVRISIGGSKYSIVGIAPSDDAANPAVQFLLASGDKEHLLLLPMEALNLLTEGMQYSGKLKAAFAVSRDEVYSGELSTKTEDGGYLSLSGELRNANSKAVSVNALLHEAAGGMGNSEIEIRGHRFIISGTLGTMTYSQLEHAIAKYPDAETLEFAEVDGSVNDDVNVHTGRLVRNAGLNTRVSSDSRIYSGGVDLFAAGVERIVEEGAELGVHSWCCVEEKTAAELPREHAAHASQLSYFSEMLGPVNGPDFYFFTLEAAPFDSVKAMSLDEMVQFKLATRVIKAQ